MSKGSIVGATGADGAQGRWSARAWRAPRLAWWRRRKAAPTLGQRLLRQVLVPLSLTWIAGTAGALVVAHLFAESAFDRALLDDAYLIASHAQADAGGIRLSLTRRELRTVLFDQDETVYYSVRRPDGSLVSGHEGLPSLPRQRDTLVRFGPAELGGKPLRAVSLHRSSPEEFDVTVAQTTMVRDAVMRKLALILVLLQSGLLAVLALWLHRRISEDTRPLAELEQALQQRGADDLAPVASNASTLDIQGLAAAINSLLQRLDASTRAQREFTGNVAHELRTPLAGIRALAAFGLAQREPAVWREQLEAIARSEARASVLVDRLLALALVLEAENRPQLQPLALDQVVRDGVLRFLARADSAGADLGARGLEEPAWILGDAALVEGILNNLVDNALRYAVEAGRGSAVTVAIDRAGDEFVLSVQDDGPGCPGELQAALAARGAQGQAGQLVGQGAGLGLALVAQYARLMKARMALRTGPAGRGWLCEVAFPVLEQSA